MGWTFQHKPPIGWPLDYNSGLVPEAGFWPMWEGDGITVADLSGNGNTGTRFGTGTIWSPGKFGSAQIFNGTDDYVEVLDNDNLDYDGSQNRTIAFWFYAKDVTGVQTIINKWENMGGGTDAWEYITFLNGSVLTVYACNVDAGPITHTISVATWHHVVVTMTSAKLITLYVDGIQRDQYTSTGTITLQANNPLRFAQNDNNNFFNGLIDLPIIYNRIPSASEIALLYEKPFGMFKDPAEMILAAAGQVVGVTVPIMTYHYKQAGGL